MKKRKRVDEMRWAVLYPSGAVSVYFLGATRRLVRAERTGDETVIRVHVTEVVKKRRKKR